MCLAAALALNGWTALAFAQEAVRSADTEVVIAGRPIDLSDHNGAGATASGGLWSNATRGVNRLLDTALGYIGVSYRHGGETPESGFDCSGLVRWVYDRTFGIVLPRRAEDMAHVGTVVQKDDLKPGDLVFFNTLRRRFSHIGIYIGEGRFVHAPRTGATVRVEQLDEAYWRKRWNGARRIDTTDAR